MEHSFICIFFFLLSFCLSFGHVLSLAKLAWAVEYTDLSSAEGSEPPH